MAPDSQHYPAPFLLLNKVNKFTTTTTIEEAAPAWAVQLGISHAQSIQVLQHGAQMGLSNEVTIGLGREFCRGLGIAVREADDTTTTVDEETTTDDTTTTEEAPRPPTPQLATVNDETTTDDTTTTGMWSTETTTDDTTNALAPTTTSDGRIECAYCTNPKASACSNSACGGCCRARGTLYCARHGDS